MSIITIRETEKTETGFTARLIFGDRYSSASTYGALGTLAQTEDNYPEARNYLQQALEIYVEYQYEYWAGVTREILKGLPE